MLNYVAQVLTFADIEGGETFDASLLGSAEEVVEDRVSDDDIILIKGAKSSRAVGTLKPDYPLSGAVCAEACVESIQGFCNSSRLTGISFQLQ
jgi:hypothetical protein